MQPQLTPNMKKNIILVSLVVILAPVIGLLAEIAGYFSFSGLGFPGMIGGIFACSLLLFAIGDYTRKPRFRVRCDSTAIAPAATPAKASEVEAATLWTHTTVSV
jgi:hypothetical protein